MGFAASGFAGSGFVMGCGEAVPTQVVVQFHARPTVLTRASTVRIVVRDFEGQDVEFVRDIDPAGGSLVANVPVSPRGGDPTRSFRIHAELLTGTDVVAEKLVIGRYASDELREVRVWFEPECMGVECADGRSCYRGRCVGGCYAPAPLEREEASAPACGPCEQCLDGACAPVEDGQTTPEGDGCGCTGDRCEAGSCAVAQRVARVDANGGINGDSTRYAHTCAIASNEVYCWGSNRTGQIGGSGSSDVPRMVAGAGTVEWVGTGREHTCAVGLVGGSRSCWGYNGHGNVSDGPDSSYSEPQDGGDAEPQLTQVSAGWFHTVALTDDGRVLTWGLSGNGVLGRADAPLDPAEALPIPTVVDEQTDWTAVAAGGLHTCAIRGSGALWCWGWNDDGEVGVGNKQIQPLPVQTACVDGTCFGDIRVVGLGEFHTCAVRAGGDMWCVGKDVEGQLGLGPDVPADDRTTWQQVAGGWRTVDGGGSHTCGIRLDGTLWCWGNNSHGELGTGDLAPRRAPTRVTAPGGDGWATVGIGDYHSCAIRESDGTLWCWGRNDVGQVGIGLSGEDILVPSRVCLVP
jgi:alpha-tubulin suppressor-like RCC1 family protein